MLFLTEVDETHRFLKPYEMEMAEAWQQWKQYSCVEWNGDHLWILDLNGPEDDNSVYIRCEYCRASPYDIFGDHEIYGTVEVDGVEVDIEYDKHSEHCTVEDIPVSLALHVEKYGYEVIEYDVWLVLSPRS